MTEAMLAIEQRDEKGTAAARRIRRAGKVPAIIYGEIDEPLRVSLDAHQLHLALKKKQAMLNLSLGKEKHSVVIREIQYHPVDGRVLHVDFLEIKKGQKLTMTIPVQLEGIPNGVKEGGILDVIKHEVEIEVLPKDIPDFILANIEHLQLGDVLRVKDLAVENFEIITEEDSMLCRVEIPRAVEEEETEAEEEFEEEAAEPEVITARDKKEDEESKE